MKCFNGHGSILAEYGVTSGEMYTELPVPNITNYITNPDVDNNSQSIGIELPSRMDYIAKDKGPIPPGDYAIHPSEVTNTNRIGGEIIITISSEHIEEVSRIDSDYVQVSVSFPRKYLLRRIKYNYAGDWGSHFVRMHPLAGTETFGRHGFYIHGGRGPGSIGCIDIGGNMANFVDKLMIGDPSRTVEVAVTNSINY